MEKFLEMLFERLRNKSKHFPEDEWHFERDMVDMDDVKEVFGDVEYEYKNVTLCYETADVNHGWIPCNKDLPKEVVKDCLVTLKNGAVLQASYNQIANEFRMICMHGITPFHEDNPVIAWRPMPSGYEPVDEDEV